MPDAIAYQNAVVVGFTRAGIADARAVSNRDKTADPILSRFVRADPIVTAFDSADVLKDHVTAIAMDVEPVVVGMRGGDVSNDKVRVVASELGAGRSNGDFNVRVQSLPECRGHGR